MMTFRNRKLLNQFTTKQIIETDYARVRKLCSSSAPHIHPTVQVGQFSIIDDTCIVEIEKECRIHHHVVIRGDTRIGENTEIHSFSCIGGDGQSKKSFSKGKTIIGRNCVVREHVTINRGTVGDTVVGDNTWMLAGSHVGHDAQIGSSVIISNAAQIAGHVKIGDFAVLGGLSAFQQFCVVGKGSMIGGGAIVDRHIPPWSLVVGNRAEFRGINLRGLRRSGVPNEHILPLLSVSKKVYTGDMDIVGRAFDLFHSMAKDPSPKNKLALEFLEFIATSGVVRSNWCARRAGIGVVTKTP
jgi:UDP-N-acetylglucosamine acyltransferase